MHTKIAIIIKSIIAMLLQ